MKPWLPVWRPASRAEESKSLAFQRSGKHAILIGINSYQDREIRGLRFCVADAKLMADLLVQGCGYKPEEVVLLVAGEGPGDGSKDPRLVPTKQNLEIILARRLKEAKPGDTVLLFFSGHGYRDPQMKQSYLATQDCTKADIADTGLSTAYLKKVLDECRAQQKLLVLDSCHSGAATDLNKQLGASKQFGPARPAETKAAGELERVATSGQLSEVFANAKGLVTLASCAGDQVSYEWKKRGHGLFTYFFADGLAGRAETDEDGVIDTDEVDRHLVKNVPLVAKRELSGVQIPQRRLTDGVGIFPLAIVTPHGKESYRLLVDWSWTMKAQAEELFPQLENWLSTLPAEAAAATSVTLVTPEEQRNLSLRDLQALTKDLRGQLERLPAAHEEGTLQSLGSGLSGNRPGTQLAFLTYSPQFSVPEHNRQVGVLERAAGEDVKAAAERTRLRVVQVKGDRLGVLARYVGLRNYRAQTFWTNDLLKDLFAE